MEKQTETQIELWRYVEKHKPAIENALREHLPLAPPKIETKFNEAVEYALFSGGKRLRPVLTLLGAELFGGKPEIVMPAACAVEFVHTSSLIFDDLPCMDNAPERRGKTSLHENFDEGLAVLVGIGFLNAAYGLIFANHDVLPERAIAAHAELVECIGAAGMLGGQSVDLALAKGAGNSPDFESESVRNLKTSALMRLCLRVGAILSGANHFDLTNLSLFAAHLGDAYQLSDDLIDLNEDAAIFSDGQQTFAVAHGESSANAQLQKTVADAKRILIDNFPAGEAQSCLIQLTDYLAERKI